MADCTIRRESDGERAVYRVSGAFDRAGAWALRELLAHEAMGRVLLDFGAVRDFSDLAVAVLAHGLTENRVRVAFRGLRQHHLRIFRYCGVPYDESVTPAGIGAGAPAGAPAAGQP